MSRRGPRMHTIYDVMDEKGVFDSNPANMSARDASGLSIFKGPVQYPKMFYHPEGLLRQTSPGEILATPLGPKKVGEQWAIETKIAETEAEAKVLKASGWHEHPADAEAARMGVAPPQKVMTPQEIDEMRAANARMTEQLRVHDEAALSPKVSPKASVVKSSEA